MGENLVIWHLFNQFGAGLTTAEGGISVPGIEAGFNLWKIPADARPELFGKLMALLSELLAKKED